MRMNMKKFAVAILTFVVVLGNQAVFAFEAEPEAVEPKAEVPAKLEAASQTLPGDVLARVNGSAITRAEVDRVIRIFIAQSRVSHELSPEARTQAEEAALEQLIATRLLYQTGLKQETMNLDKQIADKVNQEKTKFATPAAYEAALKANNLTGLDAREIVANDIVVANLLDREVIGKIVVSAAEIKTFFDQDKEKFTKPESVRLSHILIGVELQATAEEKQKAREKVESIHNKILAGADFADIAKAESSCPSKEQGGDLGIFEKGEMIPEFEKATDILKPGEISQVVETRDGFHVLKLVEKKNASVEKFEDARDKIEYYLKQIKTQQAVTDYVAELRKMAKIEMTAANRPVSSAH